MSNALSDLDRVLDEESWQYLSDTHPPLAESVAKAMQAGVMPEQIRRRVLERLGAHREALAWRCEASARFLLSEKA